MKAMPQYVIAYDIHDDRRRERAARVLLRYGQRIQLSVFVAHLDADQQIDLRRELGILLRTTDALEMFPIDQRLVENHVAWCHEPYQVEAVRVVG